MKNGYRLLLLVLMLSLIATVFSTELRVKQTLQWNHDVPAGSDGNRFPVFNGFAMREYAGELPVFVWPFEDVQPDETVEAWFENVVLEEREAAMAVTPADSALLLPEPKPVLIRSIDRGRHSAEIGFVPAIRMPDGKIRLIRSFDLVVARKPIASGLKQSAGVDWKLNSRLAAGVWSRILVTDDGVYRITYNDLTAWGIDPATIDPAKIGLYGNGGVTIPETNTSAFPDDLQAVAIEVVGGGDGSFDQGDFIRFWGNGPSRWTYNTSAKRFKQNKNPYTLAVPYFLNTDDASPARVTMRSNVNDNPTHVVSTFPDFRYFKPDSLSPSRTGRGWVSSKVFRTTDPRNFEFTFPNAVLTSAANLELSVAGWSNESNSFYASVNGSQLIKATVRGLIGLELNYNTGVPMIKSQTFFPSSDQVGVAVSYDMSGANPLGYLEYLSLQVTRRLIYTGGMMPFFYSPDRETLKIPEMVISNLTDDALVWDVTVPDSTVLCEVAPGSVAHEGRIRMNTTSYHRFVIFEPGDELEPVFGGVVQNQNLHSLQPSDYVIVAPDSLMEQAERLADLHRIHSNLTCLVVPVHQVLNEFGGGIADPMAIRGFMRMLYDRGLVQGRGPKYLLLFGDGSYDPLDRIPNNQSLIPAYQSLESYNLGASYVTDDFFGLLDDGEGDSAKGTLDLGIGRFPVATIGQATQVVDKIEHYLTRHDATTGDWRNRFTFAADDEDSNTHIDQSNRLVNSVDTLLPGQVINKVYFDAFVQTSTPSGNRYPDAKSALNQYVEDGCQVVNYTGHGGELGWSTEKVLEIPDVESWTNLDRLPLFITATCEFSRFDDPGLLSAGERVLLNPAGGGIALITTTRLAYSTINFNLNTALYKLWFAGANPGEYAFGDIIRMSKNFNKNDYRMRNISLLGDPALRPAYPANRVRITRVNEFPVGGPMPALQAMASIRVEGEVVSSSSALLTGFNGLLSYSLYDKPVTVNTLVNDPASKPFQFEVTNQLLTRGTAKVENGRFDFTFVAPRTMQQAGGNPLFSLYAADSAVDATGNEKGLYFEGSSVEGLADDQPPVIKAWLDSRSFQNGDLVGQAPLLIAEFSDNLGINFTGLGFGHDITAVIDGQSGGLLVLNEFYQPALNDARAGSLSMVLPQMATGIHTLELKAFDLNNNPATLTLYFEIGGSVSAMSVSDLKVVPNPFTESVAIYFTHNVDDATLMADFQVFDLTGRQVYSAQVKPQTVTGAVSRIGWDGCNNGHHRLPDGFYPARLTLWDAKGNTVSTGFKLVKSSQL